MAATLRWRWARFRLVIDHYPTAYMWLLLYVMIAPDVLPADAVTWTTWVALALLVGHSLARNRHNPIHPCCVARFPRDPERYMSRHATELATIHWLWHGRRLFVAIGAWLAIDAVLIFTVPINGVTNIVMPVVILAPLYLCLRIAQVHRNVVWFCPVCWRGRGDGGDDQVPEPEPEPEPTGTKTLQPA